MKKIPTIAFSDFVKKFPKVDLPVTLTEDTQMIFSKKNNPLSKQMIEEFIIPLEEDAIDEFTEYVPCFRLSKTKNFQGIVYWKAGLMTYQYFLVTFDKKGNLIEKKVIAGTEVKKDALRRTIATIKEDWTIPVVEGVAPANDDQKYDPATSLASTLQLQPDGTIETID